MAKEEYSISLISKKEAKPLLDSYHYLSHISKGFKSGYNYGLFLKGNLVGVCIFTGLPVPELAKSMFGLSRDEQEGIFELSRLCLCPSVQNTEHNLASWFVSRCLKQLRKQTKVRAVLSYADSCFHQGTVYSACNFSYYGLTETKKDFWVNQEGMFTKQSRGSTKGIDGEWRERSRKHRYVIVYDKTLTMLWEKHEKQTRPERSSLSDP